MNKSMVIGIFGCEQTDLCIYLASILENMRKRVLVIDNSSEQKMSFCIPKPEQNLITYTCKNIDYEAQIPWMEWQQKDYDYILVDFGRIPEPMALGICEELFLVTGTQPWEIQFYRNLLMSASRPVNVIYYRHCKDFISLKQVSGAMELENCFVLERLSYPFSQEDEWARILMQQKGYQDFKQISRELEKLLFHMCRIISQGSYSEIMEALRRGKRGECW